MGSLGHAADSDFAKQCVESHNKFRALHGVQPLVWDKKVSAFAQDWADENARTGKMHHSKGSGYGENLYAQFGGKAKTPCASAAKAWYNEIKKYDFSKPKFAMNTGHFTQLVWKRSSKLGCGLSITKKSTWVSCSYHPAGNDGGYKSNVLPLLGGEGGGEGGGTPEVPPPGYI